MTTRRRQKGVALIIVLGTVALFFIVSVLCMIIAKTTRVSGKVHVDRHRARYAAESSLAHIQWMIISDRAYRPFSRNLGQINAIAEDDEEEASTWTADGRQHELQLADGLWVSFRILDANRGWNISGSRPTALLRRQFGKVEEDQAADVRNIDIFMDCLDDYIDGDDQTHLHGLEQVDYERDGLDRFPRNALLQYAEEAYWLPEITALAPQLAESQAEDLLPDDLIRIIPPAGRSFPGKPAFFSSSPQMIQALTQLSDEEMSIVLDARSQWYASRVPIRDTLGPLYTRISSTMSLQESGIYTLDVTARLSNGQISRRVTTTLDLGRLPGPNTYLSNWHRMVY